MSIKLEKGHKIDLNKGANAELNQLYVGLGWDPIKEKGFFGSKTIDVDLDASLLMFNEKHMCDSVSFRQLKSLCGSVVHSGDNRTGDGDGDDEVINIKLKDVPSHVTSMIVVINSFTGVKFDKIAEASCRLCNAGNNEELAIFPITGGGDFTAMIMVKIYRHAGSWKVSAIGEKCNGRTFDALLPTINAFL